jgi:formylglycine-generating enzyme required for sulfatase activity
VRALKCSRLEAPSLPSCNVDSRNLRRPINCLGFQDAVAYCGFRKKRLPAPNEWGRAAGGDTGTYHPWGNKVDVKPGGVCWQKREPCDVGTSTQDVSAFGVKDMAGNVAEWTADPANEGSHNQWHSEEILGGDWQSTPSGAIDVLGSITGRPKGSIVGMRAGVRCAWPGRAEVR